MYGLLIESVVEVIKKKYGEAVWDVVRKRAKIEYPLFTPHQQYSETLIQRIVKHLAEVTGDNIDKIMYILGVDFVNFVGQYGYDRILRVLGRHMRDFLNGLDNLHEYMRFSYPKLKPPSFFVEQESSSGLILHYRSKRKGFVHYVKGQLSQVGKLFYNIDVDIEVLSEKQEMDLTHVVFQLHFENIQFKKISSTLGASDHHFREVGSNLPIRSEIFFELFPFHVVFKRDLEIISVGESLRQAMKHAECESIRDVFNLIRPLMNLTWDNIMGHTNNVFELTTIEPVRRPESPVNGSPAKSNNTIITNFDANSEAKTDECLKLRGQMMYIEEWDSMIFLASPILENLDVMFQTGFYINDLSMHDSSRDLVLVGTQQSAELKLALDQEKQKSKALEDSMKKLDAEMKRTDQLLYQMIPKKIADRLRSGEALMNICEVFNSCTILFSDVVGFTSTCSQLSPMEVVSMLNEMYTKFDKCLELHNVYKVETIGDAYMVVSGLPERTEKHAIEIVEMAFDMLAAISTLRNPATGETMMIRIGCHSGPTVAGVVGLKMPRYCLFGDAVNTASRMESNSEAMKIHISESTKSQIETFPYKIVERGKVEIKGKGEMKTYFILCKLDKQGNPIKLNFEMIESNANLNKEQAPVEEDRGYSPVTMDEVRKSRISLRKMVDEASNEPEPIKVLVPEPIKQKQADVKYIHTNDRQLTSTNLSENGDEKKLNSVRRSSIKSITNGSVKSVTIKENNDSKSKPGNEVIIISYNNKVNDSSQSRKDSNKPVDSDSKKRTSLNSTSQMNSNNVNNNPVVLRSMKTQTCQLL